MNISSVDKVKSYFVSLGCFSAAVTTSGRLCLLLRMRCNRFMMMNLSHVGMWRSPPLWQIRSTMTAHTTAPHPNAIMMKKKVTARKNKNEKQKTFKSISMFVMWHVILISTVVTAQYDDYAHHSSTVKCSHGKEESNCENVRGENRRQ